MAKVKKVVDGKEVEVEEGPTPTIDVEQFRGMIEETVGAALAANRDAIPDESRGGRPQPRGGSEPTNPLADIVGGIVNPHLQANGMQAASARDAALFYAKHPEAVEHQADIERGVSEMARAGVYLTREAVYNHWRGQNIDKIMEKRDKDREDAAKKAQEAAGVGDGAPGGVPKGVKVPAGDPVTWSDDDLDKFLKSSGAQGAAVTF